MHAAQKAEKKTPPLKSCTTRPGYATQDLHKKAARVCNAGPPQKDISKASGFLQLTLLCQTTTQELYPMKCISALSGPRSTSCEHRVLSHSAFLSHRCHSQSLVGHRLCGYRFLSHSAFLSHRCPSQSLVGHRFTGLRFWVLSTRALPQKSSPAGRRVRAKMYIKKIRADKAAAEKATLLE